MRRTIPKHPRILAISPSTRGFGFAVMEGVKVLVDWGLRRPSGDKNVGCLKNVDALISHYKPNVVVLENVSMNPFRRSQRIRALSKRITTLAERRSVASLSFSREQIIKAFFGAGKGTKYEIAEMIAKEFHDELGFQLPPMRRPWMSQDSRMSIFEAVALARMVP